MRMFPPDSMLEKTHFINSNVGVKQKQYAYNGFQGSV